SSEINPEEIDLTNLTTVFDNDISIKDPNDDDEIDNHPKQQKISINIPQDCNDLIGKDKSALYINKNLLKGIYEKAKEDLGVIQQQQQSQLLGILFFRIYLLIIIELKASQESHFPILLQLAKKYLAILASASSERLFSDAGNVMIVRHTNLLPSNFEYLVFCK
ncbi:13856_t:CDS:2, partial [Funneliformis caledonium]